MEGVRSQESGVTNRKSNLEPIKTAHFWLTFQWLFSSPDSWLLNPDSYCIVPT